jgi:hypothetical protein
LGSKIDHEHKDPFVLPALKSVNERILQYQTSVATFFAKMSQSFELFLNLLLSPIAIPVRGVQVYTRVSPRVLFDRHFVVNAFTLSPLS